MRTMVQSRMQNVLTFNVARFIERSLSFVACQPLEALINLVRLLTGAICLLLKHAARVLRRFLNGEREKKMVLDIARHWPSIFLYWLNKLSRIKELVTVLVMGTST